MSEVASAFVSGPTPLRWEFDSYLNIYGAAARDCVPQRPPERDGNYAAARADVVRCFDAVCAERDALAAKLADPRVQAWLTMDPHRQGMAVMAAKMDANFSENAPEGENPDFRRMRAADLRIAANALEALAGGRS